MNHNYKTSKDYKKLLKLIKEEKLVVAFIGKHVVEARPSVFYCKEENKQLDSVRLDLGIQSHREYVNSDKSFYEDCKELCLEFIDPEPEREGDPMEEDAKIKLLEDLWYQRNPCHDYDQQGKDRFWGTVMCVFNEYAKALAEGGHE